MEGYLNIFFTSNNEEYISIQLFDVTGKKILGNTEKTLTGNNNFTFYTGELYSGIYFLKVGNHVLKIFSF